MVWDGWLGMSVQKNPPEEAQEPATLPPRRGTGKHGPRGAISPKELLSARSRTTPSLLADEQSASWKARSEGGRRLSCTRFPAELAAEHTTIAAWARGSREATVALAAQASRLTVESQRAPAGIRTSLPRKWKVFLVARCERLCGGVCGRHLSGVDREHGGVQGAEFDHRDGDPRNGHITNWQLLCLFCHEAKTKIQALEGQVPVADADAWRSSARWNPQTSAVEY